MDSSSAYWESQVLTLTLTVTGIALALPLAITLRWTASWNLNPNSNPNPNHQVAARRRCSTYWVAELRTVGCQGP